MFALEVEGEEARQDLAVWKVRRPAVGCEHGHVQIVVSVCEPRRPLVVEVRQGAFREFGFAEVGRVEPAVAKADELAGGRADRLALPVCRARERKRLERCGRRVSRAGFQLGSRR